MMTCPQCPQLDLQKNYRLSDASLKTVLSQRGPIWTDFPLLELVHLTPSQPLPSPFHEVVQQQQQEEEEEEEEEQFRRSLRNNEEESR